MRLIDVQVTVSDDSVSYAVTFNPDEDPRAGRTLHWTDETARAIVAELSKAIAKVDRMRGVDDARPE